MQCVMMRLISNWKKWAYFQMGIKMGTCYMKKWIFYLKYYQLRDLNTFVLICAYSNDNFYWNIVIGCRNKGVNRDSNLSFRALFLAK